MWKRTTATLLAILATGLTASPAAVPGPRTLPLSGAADIGRKLNPIYLADGKAILFNGNAGGNWSLFVRDPSGVVRPWGRAGNGWPGAPALWRSQGRVAFERFFRERGMSELWTARPDGSDERRIGEINGFRPEPSPDGRAIAFDNAIVVEPRRFTHQMFVLNADGSGARRLTATLSYDAAPTWSPDGKWIAFDSQRDDPNRDFNAAKSEIYLMARDGSDQRRLTHLGGRSRYASWSPRSDAIVFEATIEGNTDLYLVRARGRASPVRLTATPGAERTPSWSPDGRRILYSYEVDGAAELRALQLPTSLR